MPKMIQIRNVPDELHRLFKIRAASAGQSLSDYLLLELRAIAEKPTMDEWLERVAKLTPVKLDENPVVAERRARDEWERGLR